MKARIAVLPGDGIGPEIVPQATQVLEAIAAQYGHTFEFHAADVGGAAIDKTGRPLPDGTLKNLTSGKTYALRPLGDVLNIVKAGGVFAYARQAGLLKT